MCLGNRPCTNSMNTFCEEKSTTTIEEIFLCCGCGCLPLSAHVLRGSWSSMLIQFYRSPPSYTTSGPLPSDTEPKISEPYYQS
jgi:hypothetical protein